MRSHEVHIGNLKENSHLCEKSAGNRSHAFTPHCTPHVSRFLSNRTEYPAGVRRYIMAKETDFAKYGFRLFEQDKFAISIKTKCSFV